MKKSLLIGLLALTASSGLFAQGRPGRPDRTPPTPAEMVERRVEMLTRVLTLTAAQQAQAKTIFTDEQTAMTAMHDKVEVAQDSLQAAVKASASDAQIDSLAANLGTLHGQSLAIHSKAQSKLRGILTAEQKEKLDATRGFGGPEGRGGGLMRGRGPAF